VSPPRTRVWARVLQDTPHRTLSLETTGLRRLNSTKAEIHTIATLVKSRPLATSPTHSSTDSRELSLPRASIFTFDPGLLQPTERTHLRTPTSLFMLLDIGWSPASDSEAGGMYFRRGGGYREGTASESLNTPLSSFCTF